MCRRASWCLASAFRRQLGLKRLTGYHLRCLASGNNSTNNDGKKTHFGFEYIPEEEKEEKVYKVFENVASGYDLMNDAMSAGVHRLWKDYFIEQMAPPAGTTLIDVAGGTGDIAFRFMKYKQPGGPESGEDFDIKLPREVEAQVFMDPAESSSSSSSEEDESPASTPCSSVTVCDINASMLEVGREKAEKLGFSKDIRWLQGNAESLPVEDNMFDVYTIAFGIRNCTHIDKVLQEAYRVLKPGGRFMCLEFSRVDNPLLRMMYDNYSFQVIPVMGQVIAGDWTSYQYLVESIRQFPTQEEFAGMIRDAGFRMVSYENLTFGVTAIHSGFKIV